MIGEGYKANFESLQRAFQQEDAALVECTDAETGKPAYVICAVNYIDGEYELVPFARMFDGNPYEGLIPPVGEELKKQLTLPFTEEERKGEKVR